MGEKIKVPRWFDEWVKTVFENCWNTSHDASDDGARIETIDRIIHGYSGSHQEYLDKHRLELVKTMVCGYEVEKEKGYVKLDGSDDADYWPMYATKMPNGAWRATSKGHNGAPGDYCTRSEYDSAPAWVKACEWVPIENGSEVDS